MTLSQRVRLAWLLAAMFWTPAFGAELTVMTYNLRYAGDTPPNEWAARRPLVVECLRLEAPDVIGTQEGLYRQIKDLTADLPEYDWVGLGRDGGSRGEFMAVFYRRERLEPLEFDHFWLSDTPDVIGSSTWGNSNRRMVTWVRFRERPSGREFHFWNTHFDHQIQEAREKSARLILKRLEAVPTEAPLLLVGDFNAAAAANRVYDLLVGEGRLRDTWTEAPQRFNETIGTFNGFRPGPQDGPRIDWILCRGPVTALRTGVVTFGREGQFPSDHFPVVARVRIGD